MGGIGWIDGIPVTVIAEEKGADLHQRIARNFGCPQPEGYRKSLRLMRQAENLVVRLFVWLIPGCFLRHGGRGTWSRQCNRG